MDSIVQYQLKRSVAQSSGPSTQRTALLPILDKILGAMDKVYRDQQIAATLPNREAAEGVQLLMEEADLFEILGNVVDNAYKYSATQVRIHLSRTSEVFRVCIEDDGPGIPASDRAAVLTRGKRLDEQGIAGQGIGLAVVADICRVYQVSLDITQSEVLGGASVSLAFAYFATTFCDTPLRPLG